MKILRKTDIALILFFILLAICLPFILTAYFSSIQGDTIRVEVDNEVYATYPLNVDSTYVIQVDDRFNTLLVQNGVAKMIDANCSDKLCVHQAGISSNNRVIVCLPHRVIVEIDSTTQPQKPTIDSISN